MTLGKKDNDAALLKIVNLSCTYSGSKFGLAGKKKNKKVLDGINMEIFKGEIFGLAGVSGCGKTTLCRCILGLKNYEGKIFIDGKTGGKTGGKTSGKNEGKTGGNFQEKFHKKFYGRFLKNSADETNLKSNLIASVFQDPAGALNPVKKIGWIMEEPLKVHKVKDPGERQKQVDEMLYLVGLDPSFKNRFPHEISSGQKQRVSIGAALMLKPKLLIADEPVSALDVSSGAQIINLFKDLNEALGLSLLFVSHNEKLLSYFCERIARMDGGRISSLKA